MKEVFTIETNNQNRALIAMSGGVDSSVAAYLMKQAGYECVGATMRLYENEDVATLRTGTCCSLEDVEDARTVAARLGMPYYVFNFKEDFGRQVMDRFVGGCTPNPCIDCNRYLKFDRMYRRARELGIGYVVTGHYARIQQSETGRWLLLKGPDPQKDQSYVLYAMTQEQLAHTQFPLGTLRKEEVRAIAEAQGFVNAKKHDSQDICFVPDGDYAAFIRRRTGRTYPEGNFVDPEGHILGRHKGIIHYTIGQRRGLGVSGGRPLYVKEIRPEDNTVVLADDCGLYERTAIATDFNWIALEAPVSPIRVQARARYHQPEQAATATVLPDGRVQVTFDHPQRALTKGQAIVLYQGDVVLGGGTIQEIQTMDTSAAQGLPL